MLTQHNRDEVTAELLGIEAAAIYKAVSDLPEGSDNRAFGDRPGAGVGFTGIPRR